MKLLFLYGPPASGKFTLGSEVAKHTGYKFFHNHVTVPVARIVFPDAHEPHHGDAYSNLLKKLRLAVIEAAADEGIDLIFTLAYSGTVDDVFIAQIVQAVESKGGSVHFVQLNAPDETLIARVSNPSRQQLAKMTDPQRLKQVLETRNMRASVQYAGVLHIETALLSPGEACAQIIEHFGLARQVK